MKKLLFYFVRIGFRRMTALVLVATGRTVIQKMTGNPLFPTPPSLVELNDACKGLEAAEQTYLANRGRLDLSLRQDRFNELADQLVAVGGYVQSVALGSREIIEAAGFEVRLGNAPIGALDAPARVSAQATLYPGRVDVRWSGVRGRSFYTVWTTTDDNDEKSWRLLVQTTKNRVSVEDLEPGVTHYFRVTASGPLGASPMSGTASAKAA